MEKIEKIMNIDFESKPAYGNDEKYIKTKKKIFAGSVITNFYNKKIPKEKEPYKCLSLMMLDSLIKTDNKYYPQTFLEECKCIQDKIKTKNYIDDDDLEESDSNDETESYNDNDADREDDEDDK